MKTKMDLHLQLKSSKIFEELLQHWNKTKLCNKFPYCQIATDLLIEMPLYGEQLKVVTILS